VNKGLLRKKNVVGKMLGGMDGHVSVVHRGECVCR
jgi:hypothetical protein